MIDPFDKVIEEQAAYYGMTLDEHKCWLDKLCEYQEEIEHHGASDDHGSITRSPDGAGASLLQESADPSPTQ